MAKSNVHKTKEYVQMANSNFHNIKDYVQMAKSNVHNIKNDVHTDQKKRSEKWEFNNLSKEIIKYENAL